MADADITIKYWVSADDEYPFLYTEQGTQKGVYADVLSALTEAGGVKAERVSAADGVAIDADDALELLRGGELDIVFGAADSGRHAAADRPGLRAFRAGDDVFTALIRKDATQVPLEDVENCYWAIQSEYKGIIDGMTLMDHTIDVNTRAELEQTLRSGDVYGILVPRSCIDYHALVEGAFEFKEYEGIKIPIYRNIYLRDTLTAEGNTADGSTAEGNSAASAGRQSALPANCADIIAKVCETASERYDREDMLATYTNELIEVKTQGRITTGLAIGGCSLALVFGVLAAVLAAKNRRGAQHEKAKLAAVMAGEENKELFELNLKTKKLVAYDGFQVFGEAGKALKETADRYPKGAVPLAALDELTGFSFTEHYGGVSLHGSSIYRNRMIIHAGGKKIYITEEGRRVGETLLFVMTNVTDEVGVR